MATTGPTARIRGGTPEAMSQQYVDVAVFAILGVLFVTVTLLVGKLLRPSNPYRAKLSPYECGEEPVGEGQVRFHIRYYIFALIFVLFDVESAFLYPWSVVLERLGAAALVEMAIFIFLLVIGLVYAWKKRVLKWV